MKLKPTAIVERAAVLFLFVAVASVFPAGATIACPVSLRDGQINQDSIDLSFRNKGKLPIQRLEFSCLSAASKSRRRTTCHEEFGIFFPGNAYEMNFSYAVQALHGPLAISLRSARLSDGSTWMANRDQPCKPITIKQRRS